MLFDKSFAAISRVISHWNAKQALFLLLALCLTPHPETAHAAGDPGARRLAISDAMMGMMDAMGLFGSATPDPLAFSGAAGSGQQMAQRAGDLMQNIIAAPGLADKLPKQTPFEGVWQGQQGEWLAFKGSRFRLLASAKRRLEGIVYLRDSLIAFHSPRHNKTWVFEYAQQQGRLALRDTQRRLYLFRKVEATTPTPTQNPAKDKEIDNKAAIPPPDG